jgi:hypothetical protein
MIGKAKKDRKKTACPGGTSTDAALTRLAIPMNIQTDMILKTMPRSGCMVFPLGATLGRRPTTMKPFFLANA